MEKTQCGLGGELGAVINELHLFVTGKGLKSGERLEDIVDRLRGCYARLTADSNGQVIGVPFLLDRADGAPGHYAIARIKDKLGTHEYWNRGAWCAFGQVFRLGEVV